MPETDQVVFHIELHYTIKAADIEEVRDILVNEVISTRRQYGKLVVMVEED